MALNVEESPKVTIGIMAYNEERYLAQTIESIQCQPFTNYEIIIADNASDDKTGDIGKEYASKCPKIRYFRHKKNIGALQNFNSLVRMAQSQYFVLAGAHDLWSDNFLSGLFDVLERRPEVVLAYGLTQWIDEQGNLLAQASSYYDTSGLGAVGRFNMVIWGNQHAMYGMYRLDALRKTRLQLSFIGSGAVMLGELALLGDITIVPEVTWYRRKNHQPETLRERHDRYNRVLFPKPKTIRLPHWHMLWAYLGAILHIELSLFTKFMLVLSLWNVILRYHKLMIFDIHYSSTGRLSRGR